MKKYLFLFLLIPSVAFANYNIGNLAITGVGSSTTGLTVGNIGVGTVLPGAVLDVEGSLTQTVFYGSSSGSNVGIGSINPGQTLDVTGTIRSNGFINSSGTTGAMICLTAAHQLGHCTGSASCSSTCTCTCAVN